MAHRAVGHPSEKDFQEAIVQLAALNGWLIYHTHDSRRSEGGFPDLVMVRDSELVFAELKVKGRKPTPAQVNWLRRLHSVAIAKRGLTPTFRVCVWTPDDWDEIASALARNRRRLRTTG